MRKFSKSKTYRTMINYSIVKRSVNANLIEINQAKSRINQAKKEGKDNVDISKPASPSTGGSTEGGGSQTGGSGSQTEGGGTGDGE